MFMGGGTTRRPPTMGSRVRLPDERGQVPDSDSGEEGAAVSEEGAGLDASEVRYNALVQMAAVVAAARQARARWRR